MHPVEHLVGGEKGHRVLVFVVESGESVNYLLF